MSFKTEIEKLLDEAQRHNDHPRLVKLLQLIKNQIEPEEEPLTAEQTAVAETEAAHESYPHRVAVAGDIFLNVLRGGQEDVTISTATAEAAAHGNRIAEILNTLLNDFQSQHGEKAMAADLERATAAAKLATTSELITPEASIASKPNHATLSGGETSSGKDGQNSTQESSSKSDTTIVSPEGGAHNTGSE